MYKVAVPTDDGQTISGHFGRAAGFLIYSIEDAGGKNSILGSELRQSLPHDGGEGNHGHASHQHDAKGSHSHHQALLTSVLHDCQAVIAGGIGPPMARALHEEGLELYLSRRTLAREAVTDLLEGRLQPVGPADLPPDHHHHVH